MRITPHICMHHSSIHIAILASAEVDCCFIFFSSAGVLLVFFLFYGGERREGLTLALVRIKCW